MKQKLFVELIKVLRYKVMKVVHSQLTKGFLKECSEYGINILAINTCIPCMTGDG